MLCKAFISQVQIARVTFAKYHEFQPPLPSPGLASDCYIRLIMCKAVSLSVELFFLTQRFREPEAERTTGAVGIDK